MKKFVKKSLRQAFKKVVDLVAILSHKHQHQPKLVHHLRTETRRSDATLRLFENWLPSGRVARVQSELKKIRRRAGEVRDLDIIQPLLVEIIGELPPDVVGWVLKQYESDRRKNTKSLAHYCSRSMKRDLKSKTQSIIKRMSWDEVQDEPTSTEMTILVIDSLRQSFQDAVSSLSDDVNDLHQVRKIGRRLRYSLEALDCLQSNDLAKTICAQLTDLQDTLGNFNDRQSAIKFLRSLESEYTDKPFIQSLAEVVIECVQRTDSELPAIIEATRIKAASIRLQLENLTNAIQPKNC